MNNNNKLIENFLETIHAERNASHNTLLAYRRDLEAFVYFLSKKRINLLKANRKDIETYIISLDKSGMSEATRARHLSAIKQIYRYGYDESLIKENPSTDIKGPKSKRKLPTNLSESEIDKLLYDNNLDTYNNDTIKIRDFEKFYRLSLLYLNFDPWGK